MDKHIIRENAGKLWRLLSTDVHRKWNLQEVKELTGFNDLEVASAIGWLARGLLSSLTSHRNRRGCKTNCVSKAIKY